MKRNFSLRELTLYSLLGVLIFAAKMAMAQLPNIEPVSLMVILLAVCCGRKGLSAVAVYVALEIFMWGLDIWSVTYLYVWPILFCLARLFRRMEYPLGWAVLSGAFGLCFGGLCSLVYLLSGGWAAAVTWWVSGIPMDLLHCGGNFAMAFILFRPLRKLLGRLMLEYQR